MAGAFAGPGASASMRSPVSVLGTMRCVPLHASGTNSKPGSTKKYAVISELHMEGQQAPRIPQWRTGLGCGRRTRDASKSSSCCTAP